MKGKMQALILGGKPLAILYLHLWMSILTPNACLLSPWDSSLCQGFISLLSLTSQAFLLLLFHRAVSDYGVKGTLRLPSKQLWDYSQWVTTPGNPGCSVAFLITVGSYRSYLVGGE